MRTRLLGERRRLVAAGFRAADLLLRAAALLFGLAARLRLLDRRFAGAFLDADLRREALRAGLAARFAGLLARRLRLLDRLAGLAGLLAATEAFLLGDLRLLDTDLFLDADRDRLREVERRADADRRLEALLDFLARLLRDLLLDARLAGA